MRTNTELDNIVVEASLNGLEAIYCEIDGLKEMAENLRDDAPNFHLAIKHILDTDGRVIVCGMGKSGIVGKKLASSLASTGTPSFFMHPGEAFHGDLGMVQPNDVFLALSNSGTTEEVLKLLPFLEDNGNVIISFTKNHDNPLAKAATVSLRTGVTKEACPLQLAPTSSTTAAMVMGDAITVALLRARDFQPEDFARFHPGGALGKKLLHRVEDVMVTENLPFVREHTNPMDLMCEMSKGKLGLAIIGTPTDVIGIITDGDVRRFIEETHNQSDPNIYDSMTRRPECCHPRIRFGDAMEVMENKKLTSLLVVDAGLVVGVVKK